MNTCCVQFPKSMVDYLHARESRVLCVSYFLRSWKWPGIETWQIEGEVKTKGVEEEQTRNSIKFDNVEENVGILSSWENAVANILAACLSVSVTREMVESLRVAMYCYGNRVTRGNVWKNTSAFTFSRDYASWQVYKQYDRKTSCFDRIRHTSIRVLTLITNLKAHFSEFVTSTRDI
jgi:hypothetical protein